MKCIIIEDQMPAQRILKKYIRDLGTLELVGTFSDALEVVHFLNRESVDLLFLDIHLPKLSGISLLKSMPNRPKVILTTAFSEYAVESYELDVVDYLLKPFSFERFVKAVSKAAATKGPGEQSGEPGMRNLSSDIFIKSGHDYIKVNTNDILYLNSDSDYTDIYLSGINHISSETLKYWESRLSQDKFVRVHKSYIVNLEKVVKISGNRIYLIQNIVIPIGRTYKKSISSRFIK